MICTPIFQTTTKERRNMLDNNKTINELVQERMDAKPWYKKPFIIPERYLSKVSFVTLVLAILSFGMTMLMAFGKMPVDTGIVLNIRVGIPFVMALFVFYNWEYMRIVRKNICKEICRQRWDKEHEEANREENSKETPKSILNDIVQDIINEEPWYKRIFLLPAKYNTHLLYVLAFSTAITSCIMSMLMNAEIMPRNTGIFMHIRLWTPMILTVIAIYNTYYRANTLRTILKALDEIENKEKGKEE